MSGDKSLVRALCATALLAMSSPAWAAPGEAGAEDGVTLDVTRLELRDGMVHVAGRATNRTRHAVSAIVLEARCAAAGAVATIEFVLGTRIMRQRVFNEAANIHEDREFVVTVTTPIAGILRFDRAEAAPPGAETCNDIRVKSWTEAPNESE